MGRYWAFTGGLALASTLSAIYAPVPQFEVGRTWTLDTSVRAYYDSNIFGLNEDEVDSFVFALREGFSFNSSVTDQTFLEADASAEMRIFTDRPTEDVLANLRLSGTLDHTFSEKSFLLLSLRGNLIDDPEASRILGAADLQPEQSHRDLAASGEWEYRVLERVGVVTKGSFYDIGYDFEPVGDLLDRRDYEIGAELTYDVLPELTALLDYRFKKVVYAVSNNLRGSSSDFYLVGFDYAPSPVWFMEARAGVERRAREALGDKEDTYFYGNLRGVYQYIDNSYFSLALDQSVREASNTADILNEETLGLIFSWQHDLTGRARLFASATAFYEWKTLEARNAALGELDEENSRFGLGLTWEPRDNVRLHASYDWDLVRSDLANREQERQRIGIFASYQFGP